MLWWDAVSSWLRLRLGEPLKGTDVNALCLCFKYLLEFSWAPRQID